MRDSAVLDARVGMLARFRRRLDAWQDQLGSFGPLRSFFRVLGHWEPILWGACVIAAATIVGLRYEIGQSSDGLLQSLISLQHLSFFFWGQDRFANLVPWLASGVHDPAANAAFQLAVRIGFGVAAPLLFCAPLVRAGDRFGAGRVTLLATALALAFMPQRFVFEWFIEASPYGTSFALSGFALLLFSAAAGRGRWGGIGLRVGGLLLVFAAYAVNASLVMVAAPMFLLLVLLRSAVAMEFLIASVVSGLGVALAAATTDVAHTQMRFGETIVGLMHYLQSLMGKTGIFLGAMLGMFVVAAVVSASSRDRSTVGSNRAFIGYGIVLLVTFVIVFVAVSLSSWVVANLLHPRYLVPLFCLMAALGSISIDHLVDRFAGSSAVRGKVMLGLCVLVLGCAGLRGLAPVPRENGIVSGVVRPLATEIAGIVTTSRLDAIAGDYWVVWPSVFVAEERAFRLQRPVGQVFGVTYRSEARRQALADRLQDQGRLRILCVDIGDATCLEETSTMIGEKLSITDQVSVRGRLGSDPMFRVVTLAPR